jgi:outer membrane receptor for ferrienterochelin and colicin
MDFRHEILAYGGINPNNGLEMTVNADRSVHSGIELTADASPIRLLKLSANWAFNYNRVKKYSSDFSYATADGDSSYAVDFKNKTLSGFPSYLGNLLADYNDSHVRLTYRMRFAGKQYMELSNADNLAIREHVVTSITASYRLTRFRGIGTLKLSATIDNLFNVKHESSGYGGNYAYEGDGGVVLGGWAEYFVGAERNFYTQLELDLF